MTSESTLFNGKDDLNVDLYDLMITKGDDGNVIIATPNIAFETLLKKGILKKEFMDIANVGHLNLLVVFYDLSTGNGVNIELKKWALGNNGRQTRSVYIFPGEYFSATKGLEKFFEFAAERLRS